MFKTGEIDFKKILMVPEPEAAPLFYWYTLFSLLRITDYKYNPRVYKPP